jgi:hypothetical protein
MQIYIYIYIYSFFASVNLQATQRELSAQSYKIQKCKILETETADTFFGFMAVVYK